MLNASTVAALNPPGAGRSEEPRHAAPPPSARAARWSASPKKGRRAPPARARTSWPGPRARAKGGPRGLEKGGTMFMAGLFAGDDDPEAFDPAWDASGVLELQRAFSQMHDLHAQVDPELVRGVTLGQVMEGVGRHFAKRAQHANDASSASFAVPTVDTFISHTWSTSQRVKYIGLFVEFCALPAAAASVLAAGAAALMQASDLWTDAAPLLPAHGCYRSVRALGCAHDCCELGLWSCVFGAATFVLVGVAWPSVTWVLRALRLSHRAYFLDKLCIDQNSAEGKQAGIRALGQILARTRRMHIMWSPGYFQRLWCIFELSAFLQIRASREAQAEQEDELAAAAAAGAQGRRGARALWARCCRRRRAPQQELQLTALPLGHGIMMLMLVLWLVQLLSVAYSTAASQRAAAHGVGGVSRDSVFALFKADVLELFAAPTRRGAFQRIALSAVFGVLVLYALYTGGRWLRRCVDCHITIRETLRAFSVRDAQCHAPEDKVLIHAVIGRWYSDERRVHPAEGLRKFEQLVRTRTLRDVDASMGTRGALPTQYLLLIVLAASWGALDWMASLARARAGPEQLSRLIFVFAVPASILPLAMQLSLTLLYALRQRFADTLLYGQRGKGLSNGLASALLLASMGLLAWPVFHTAHHHRPGWEALLVLLYLLAWPGVTLSGALLRALDEKEDARTRGRKPRTIQEVRSWISSSLL